MIDSLMHGPWALAGIFLLGLGLNLTPCVYPMLSVTFSLFGTQRSHHTAHAFGRAVIYVLGMATMYTALGAAAALTGGFFGAALQSKAVLLGVAVLFFVLSLSLFGVYSLQIPGWLLARVGHKGKKHVGLLALYFYGLVAGLFAAPCIGPPVIALLALVGTKGDPVYAVEVFFVMALGLGFPYILIATFTGLMHRLPRSGVWLLWVDRVFGSVLLGVAGFYAFLALDPKALPYAIPAGIAAGGIYLGFLEKAGDGKAGFTIFKRAFGAALLIAAAALFPVHKAKLLPWEMYAPAQLAVAKTAGQPVIMDFYADWCIPCHELDRFTFSNTRVQQELARFKRLKVDMTHPDAEETQKLIEQFDIQGVPTILFLSPGGQELKDARVSGFIEAKDLLGILGDERLGEKSRSSLVARRP